MMWLKEAPQTQSDVRDNAYARSKSRLPYKMNGEGYDDRFASVLQRMYGVDSLTTFIQLQAGSMGGDPFRIIDVGGGQGDYLLSLAGLRLPIERHLLDSFDYAGNVPGIRKRIGDAHRVYEYYPERYFHAMVYSNVAVFLGDPVDVLLRQSPRLLHQEHGLLVANRVPLLDMMESQGDADALMSGLQEGGALVVNRGRDIDIGIPGGVDLSHIPLAFAGVRTVMVHPGGGLAVPHAYSVYRME